MEEEEADHSAAKIFLYLERRERLWLFMQVKEMKGNKLELFSDPAIFVNRPGNNN